MMIMAEAVITVVLDNLVKVAATGTMSIVSLLGLAQDLAFLSSEFSAIKNVLQDAETRQISEESVRSWLQKLKYVAYDLDDLLEEWIICFGDQVRNSSSSNLISLVKHPIQHLKYRKRVNKIRRRLEQIAREKRDYQFSSDTLARRMREERRTDSWVEQTSVIGRDEDKETLISKLMNEEGFITCGSGDKVPTIFIWGMGGLGKTTLAKSIYNDERVKEHFGGKCMWVCVGEVFDRELIMKIMIESLGGSVNHSHQWREQLAEMLKDGPYLLILDDVWNENYLEWEPLLEILNQGAKGSRIVITTRNRGVVSKIRSFYTHQLEGLGEDECLLIFKKVVVEQGKEEEYEPLMDIGKKIVKKCGGLPLAVKTVASAVRGRVTREQWENVLNSKIWDMTESEEDILPALILSYTELPQQLKSCFGYCSIFEKDALMKKDELIRLWVCQGYIVVNDRGKEEEEEEVGEECFNELLARSMFQDPERDEGGIMVRCKMHDLVHDLAQWVSKKECRVLASSGNDDLNDNNNALNQLSGTCHCVVKSRVSLSGTNLTGVENLRTLIYSPNEFYGEPIAIDRVLKLLKSVRVLTLRHCSVRGHHLGKLVHLRHLDLRGIRMEQLPAASIEKLKELRYLDLSDTCIKNLPEEMASLPNLRTLALKRCKHLTKMPDIIPASLRQLNLKGCDKLTELPKTIASLPHLKVINLRDCSNLKEIPEGVPSMASLRRLNIEGCGRLKKLPKGIGERNVVAVTLDRFPVVAAGGDAGGGCSSNIGELASMNVLFPPGRYLDICNLEVVGSRDEARTAKLEEKTSLHSLILSWGGATGADRSHVIAKEVLEGLRPPPQLIKLNVKNYPGPTFPGWMSDGGGTFRHLREVELENCENCTQLPPLGQLPSLERLAIVGLGGVERIGREFFGGPSPTFPCLTHLKLQNMRNWSHWVASPCSDGGGSGESQWPHPFMPALKRVEFIDCPKVEAMSSFFTASNCDVNVRDCSLALRLSLQLIPNPRSLNICIREKATDLPAGILHHMTPPSLEVSPRGAGATHGFTATAHPELP